MVSYIYKDNYYIREGTNTLNGAYALSYVRERKAFADGDNARGRHQMEMIEAIISEGKLECLKPELRQTAIIRINNPETNLSELGELHNPPVTKSCVNHRLKKIEEFCEENCRKD